MPAPGVMVHLSPEFNPPILKGIKVYPDNPFRFDFILDKGDSQLSNDALKDESSKLIKYFLASLTIPEKDLWVNLPPYEKNRIVPESFGQTEMGRDLLAEDYMLKQITASLIYPEGEVGKRFWKRIYEEASRKFGTTNIPVNTFNKVWIVPEKAVVYENAPAIAEGLKAIRDRESKRGESGKTSWDFIVKSSAFEVAPSYSRNFSQWLNTIRIAIIKQELREPEGMGEERLKVIHLFAAEDLPSRVERVLSQEFWGLPLRELLISDAQMKRRLPQNLHFLQKFLDKYDLTLGISKVPVGLDNTTMYQFVRYVGLSGRIENYFADNFRDVKIGLFLSNPNWRADLKTHRVESSYGLAQRFAGELEDAFRQYNFIDAAMKGVGEDGAMKAGNEMAPSKKWFLSTENDLIKFIQLNRNTVFSKGWWIGFDVDRTSDIHSTEIRGVLSSLNQLIIEKLKADGAHFFGTFVTGLEPTKEEGFIYVPDNISKEEIQSRLQSIHVGFREKTSKTVSFGVVEAAKLQHILPAIDIGGLENAPDKDTIALHVWFFGTAYTDGFLRKVKGKRKGAAYPGYGNKTVFYDKAMKVGSNTGGIDLTSDKALSVQNNGQGIKFHLEPAQLQQLQNAPGFVPVIINIQPLKSLPEFLGRLNQSQVSTN